MRFGKRSVTALALAATLLTGRLYADPSAPPPAAPPEPSVETPLALRPTKPLSLEPAPSSPGAAWKLGGFAVLAAGGYWAWKQRAKKRPLGEQAKLHILGRTAIGVRSELVLLELEGQKLLIGVTPSSMQTLYLLPDSSPDELAEAAPAPDALRDAVSERRLANLLEARLSPRQDAREAARAPLVTPSSEDDSIFEGQASGLRNLGARR
jgi:flagellar protein FliO/FliZ